MYDCRIALAISYTVECKRRVCRIGEGNTGSAFETKSYLYFDAVLKFFMLFIILNAIRT